MMEHELLEALRDLENDAAGRKFSDDEKHRWNELNEELEEYRKRRERLLELARNPRNREEGSVVDPNGGFVRAHHPRDVDPLLPDRKGGSWKLKR